MAAASPTNVKLISPTKFRPSFYLSHVGPRATFIDRAWGGIIPPSEPLMRSSFFPDELISASHVAIPFCPHFSKEYKMPRKCQAFLTQNQKQQAFEMRSQLLMLLAFHLVSPAVANVCAVTDLSNCYDNIGNNCLKDTDPVYNTPLYDGEAICCYTETLGSSVTYGYVACSRTTGLYYAVPCASGQICATYFDLCEHECGKGLKDGP